MKTNTKFLLGSLAIILGLNPIIQAQTVTIGTQVWTTKNLDVSTFRNGDVIPQASTDEAWGAAGENKQPAWCYYDNDPKNGTKYGKLYNWYAVNDSRGLAPEGYHIPTNAEWTVLADYLGRLASHKMKSTSGWYNTYHGSNSSGFSGLPGGYRFNFGPFYGVTELGSWWSATEYVTVHAFARFLGYTSGDVSSSPLSKEEGLSVRCVKD